MELNELKSTWNTLKTPTIPATEIQVMLSENKHPVLKGIRKQLIIEIIVWSIFLFCYYSMFDGDKKPLWVNILLVSSVLLPFVHNLMGYRFAKYLVHGTDIRKSLKNYLSKIKIYAIISIISRQFYLMGLIFFFTYGLHFDSNRYFSLLAIMLIFLLQLFLSCRIWGKRLKNLENSLKAFS